MKHLLLSLPILLSGSMSLVTHAAEITTKAFELYIGDLNADGYGDYYFHGQSQFVLLHGDVITPILLRGPDGFALFGNGEAYDGPQGYALTNLELEQRVSSGTLRTAQLNSDYYLWNNGLSGHSQVFMRGADITAPSVLISSFATSEPVISQVFQTHPAANLSDRSQNITLLDRNQDGYSDIVISSYAYLSGSGHHISPTPTSLNQTGPVTSSFTYDALGRLTVSTSTDGTTNNYKYDIEDNRQSSRTVKGIE